MVKNYILEIKGIWEKPIDDNYDTYKRIEDYKITDKLDNLYYKYLEKNRPKNLNTLINTKNKIQNKLMNNENVSEKEKKLYEEINNYLEKNSILEYTLFSSDISRKIYNLRKKYEHKHQYQKSFKLNDNLVSIGNDIYFKEKDGNLIKIKNKDIISAYKDKIPLFDYLTNHVNYEF